MAETGAALEFSFPFFPPIPTANWSVPTSDAQLPGASSRARTSISTAQPKARFTGLPHGLERPRDHTHSRAPPNMTRGILHRQQTIPHRQSG